MRYARIILPEREVLVPTSLKGFWKPVTKLYKQTDTSAQEEWIVQSAYGFTNTFHESNKLRCDRRLNRYMSMHDAYVSLPEYIVISRDNIPKQKPRSFRGKRAVTYISHADTDHPERSEVFLPPDAGWIVPTDDDIIIPEKGIWIPFQEKSAIPHETVLSKKEATKRLEKRGLTPEYLCVFDHTPGFAYENLIQDRVYVAYNYIAHPYDHNEELHHFPEDIDYYDHPFFCGYNHRIKVSWMPGCLHGMIASRPRYIEKNPKIIMEVDLSNEDVG